MTRTADPDGRPPGPPPTPDWVPALLVAVALFLAVACPLRCGAQDGPEPQAGPVGAPGVWFPLEDAREAVACLGDRVALGERLRLTTESLRLADAQVAVLTARGAELDSALAAALGERDAARREAQDAAAWYWSPWFWGALGLVLGVGASVAIAVAS